MMMHCGNKVMPAIVHPTKCCVKHTMQNITVPEIHPSHTTTVNHINYNHQHYFPHTESTVQEVTQTNTFMPGPGPMPTPRPGYGPRPRPGMMPMPGGPMYPY